jgi:hypothetical protein
MDLTEDSKPTSPRAGNHFFLDLTDPWNPTSSQDNEFCPQESDNKLKMSFVDLCGQVMSDGLFLKLKMNPEEYEREMKVGIQKTLQETCQIPGSFGNQQNFVEFESHLESSLNLLQQKSLLEVVEECGGGDEDLKFAKKRCRKEIEERESEKKKKMQQIEDDRTCIICLDHPRTHLIMPCFHFIACSDCIQNFAVGSECPVCRTRVMETKQVFYS